DARDLRGEGLSTVIVERTGERLDIRRDRGAAKGAEVLIERRVVVIGEPGEARRVHRRNARGDVDAVACEKNGDDAHSHRVANVLGELRGRGCREDAHVETRLARVATDVLTDLTARRHDRDEEQGEPAPHAAMRVTPVDTTARTVEVSRRDRLPPPA